MRACSAAPTLLASVATAAGISAAETLLLRTAALYHDLGYLVRYRDNEIIATALAATTLPHFGYTPEQIYAINEMIMATHMPQTPHNLLQALLCDADLDPLGREDFLEVNRRLRLELAIHDHPDARWLLPIAPKHPRLF